MVFMLAVCALPMSALAVETQPVSDMLSLSADKTTYAPGDTVTVTVSTKAGLYGLQLELPEGAAFQAWDESFVAAAGEGDTDTGKTRVMWVYSGYETGDDGNIIIEGDETGLAYSGPVCTFTYTLPGTYEFPEVAEGVTASVTDDIQITAIAAGLPVVTEGDYSHTTPYEGTLKAEFTVEKPAYAKGDIDGNGRINVFDAIAIMKYSRDNTYPVKGGPVDFDGNGRINVFDAVALMKYSRTL